MTYSQIYDSLEVYIPEEVKYCPYNGSYNQMLNEAVRERNISIVKSLIYYRDAMNEREKKIKELNEFIQNNSHKFQEKA
tara:strand:- start:146 stop:382 length:237 start_codon:yes stop_codon:yes gene_type:complete